MVLKVDTTRAIRRPDDVVALVRAVVAANAEDEAEWVEWKSTLDLASMEGQFSIAKQILGSANRMPEAASRFAEGLGYVICGAEPGQVRGVVPVDLARLGQAIAKYLGNPGPTWGAVYVEVDGRQVLVVTVEAPRNGDRMHPLAKAYQPAKGGGAQAGTVFMRKHARTEPAGPGDIHALQDRLVRGSQHDQTLDLAVGWDGHGLATVDLSDAEVDRWLTGRREAVLAMQPTPIEAPKSEAPVVAALAALLRDQRTEAEYAEEVERHLVICRRGLVAGTVFQAARKPANLVELQVVNTTARNLPDVEVVVTVEAERVWTFAADGVPSWRLPQAPVARGMRSFRADPPSSPADTPVVQYPAWDPAIRVSIDERHPAVVTLDVGDLRPQASVAAPGFRLVVGAPEAGPVRLRWSATSSRFDARQEGELLLPVRDQVLTSIDLIRPDKGIK